MVLRPGVTIQTILLVYFTRNPEYNSLWFSKGGRVGMGVVNPPKCLSTGVPMSKWGVVNPPKPLSTGVPMSKWGVCEPSKAPVYRYTYVKMGGL